MHVAMMSAIGLVGICSSLTIAEIFGNYMYPNTGLRRDLAKWEQDLQAREADLRAKTPTCGTAPGGCIAHGEFDDLVFFDDFDTFDFSKWKHEITLGGGGSSEFEYYLNNRTNSFVRDGAMYLKPTFTADTIGEANLKGNQYKMDLWGSAPADLCTGNAFSGCIKDAGADGAYINPIQSARLRTAEKFNFKYGRVEIRAKLPKGDWIWPGLWMMPTDSEYGPWPASGEIDIMESRGNDPGYFMGGREAFASSMHWGPHWPEDGYLQTQTQYKLPEGDFSQDYHIFGLYWDENELYTYVDKDENRVMEMQFDEPLYDKGDNWGEKGFTNPWAGQKGNAAPFDRSFYLIMNVAVGGKSWYFPDKPDLPWSNNDVHAANTFWDNRDMW